MFCRYRVEFKIDIEATLVYNNDAILLVDLLFCACHLLLNLYQHFETNSIFISVNFTLKN